MMYITRDDDREINEMIEHLHMGHGYCVVVWLDCNVECNVSVHQCEAVRILEVVTETTWAATEC